MDDEAVNNYGQIQKEVRYQGRRFGGDLSRYDESVRRARPEEDQPHIVEPVRARPVHYDGPTPETWTPEHVGRRLVDAFIIMDRLPGIEKPKNVVTAWVVTERDPEGERSRPIEERLAELQNLAEQPTQVDISRMELAIEWLRSLRTQDAGIALQLTAWAHCVAHGRSIRRLCIDRKWNRENFRRKIRRGKEWIADQLAKKSINVF